MKRLKVYAQPDLAARGVSSGQRLPTASPPSTTPDLRRPRRRSPQQPDLALIPRENAMPIGPPAQTIRDRTRKAICQPRRLERGRRQRHRQDRERGDDPNHWEVVNFLRDYYNEYQIAPAVRVLTKAIGKQLGPDKGNSKVPVRTVPLRPGQTGLQDRRPAQAHRLRLSRRPARAEAVSHVGSHHRLRAAVLMRPRGCWSSGWRCASASTCARPRR